MISQTAEYALRAMVCLAEGENGGRTSQDIAECTNVSQGYLVKVLQRLCRASLVISRRGPSGGFQLARSPEEINLLQVINAVDPISRYVPDDQSSEKLRTLTQMLDNAVSTFEKSLQSVRLNDIHQPMAVAN